MDIYKFLFSSIPDAIAFEDIDGSTFTYSYLEEESAKVANWIKQNKLEKGSRILAQINKSISQVILYLGTVRSGLIYVPLNPSYMEKETQRIIEDCKPILHFKGNIENFWKDQSTKFEIEDLYETDPAAVVYTSGTTGLSKGVILTHKNLISNVLDFDSILEWNNDVLIHCLPTFHAHGLFIALHAQFYRKGKTLWMNKFNAEECIKYMPRATLMMGVPTIYHRLVESKNLNKEISKNIRAFISASAPLPKSVAESFYKRTKKEIVERYGTTESLVIASNPLNGMIKRGTVGKVLPNTNLRIRDDEIEIKGDSVFAGYWNKKENYLTQDGWFPTGDQGKIDDQGYISITGRSKDIIISGGLKISPIEIESIIESCKGIKESAVIGIPDKEYGERPIAVIVGSDFNVQEIKQSLKSNLSKFKLPKAILQIDKLPKNDLGKIQKNILRSNVTDNIANGIIFYI